MAGVIANYAAKKLLGGQMDKYKSKEVGGDDDPFFATVQDRHGKPKKVKKQIPDYIPKHDADVLARAKSRAYHLDMSLFNLFGIRFGWSSVIGLIPELGDVIDLFFAVRLVQKCQKVEGGLPASITSQMWLNVAIDFIIGLVPFLGDLVDALFRCNTKNVALLERHLKQKHGPKDKVAQDMSGLEAFSDDSDPFIPGVPSRPPPPYNEIPRQQQQSRVAPKQPAIGSERTQGGGRWFGGWGRQRASDAEMGQESGTARS